MHLHVQTVVAGVGRIEVQADQVLGAVVEARVLVAEDLRRDCVELELLLDWIERACT